MKFINSDNLNDALSAFRTKCNAAYASKSHTHTSINYQDTRSDNTTPAQVPLGLSVHLKSNNIDGLSDGGSYHPSLMIKPWNDKSGWPVGQIAITQNNNLYFRVSKSSDDTTWNAWQKVSKDGHTHNYAGSSSAGGAATSANKLATARTIAISGGATGTATSFDGSANISIPITSVSESYLSWGGKNFAGSYGPIDAAMVPHLGANRLAFMPAAGVNFEYSTNGGSSWSTYSTSDANKINFFNGNGAGHIIGANSSTKIDKAKYMFRVTITASTAKVYTVLNKFVIYCSTNGSTGSYCTIQGRTQANVTAGTDTWVTFADKVGISGWSGYNVINISGRTIGTNSDQYGQLRFIFGVTSHANTVAYAGLTVSSVMGFGGVGWTTPSTMASRGHLYTYDASQNATFPAGISATSFTENGKALSSKYAAASHGTHVTYATTAPKANGTAAVGSVNRVAREDHVHPLQTTMNGLTFWTGTQEQYDAIATNSATTIYMITE